MRVVQKKEETVRQDVPELECVVNDASRMLESFEVGDVAHQGDIIMVRIAALPQSAKERHSRQLAEGDTQGSRHVMTRGEVYDCDKVEVIAAIKAATGATVGEQYVGPVFISPEAPTADDLQHPEHGNHGYPAGATIAVVFQRSLDSEQKEARVRD